MINVFYLKTKKPTMKKIREKHLRRRNSYSIISAPLRDINDIFNLKVHNENNLQRKTIPFNEFYDLHVHFYQKHCCHLHQCLKS
ncbi:hypothetical protein M9Y10_004736 [Tritrichomonas musculus]|uniref:Uncharacterized protein n=1 Tax=Tritrichomonas musculus TaxID=1915356 RepID=A0ABR2JKP1_9EUKA